MRIVVIGAGQVGSAVAHDLSEDHDIIVVDQDPERLDQLRYQADVMTVEGNGADIEVLESAETSKSDIVIGSTDDDRVNIIVCSTANALNPDLFTIARVANTDYLKSWKYSQNAFNVDLMLGSDFLTATGIVQVAFQQMARKVAYFDQGRIEMAEFRVPPDSPIADQVVGEAEIHPGLRYAAIYHEGELEVVRGGSVIPPDSRLVVIGHSDAVRDFGGDLSENGSRSLKRVFILGGGEIAHQAAHLLQQRDISPKVVERDTGRAEQLAKALPDSFILNDDATDPEFLKSEGIDRAQLVISALRPDESNLFSSLQARFLGAERVLSVVHDKRHEPLFEEYGVEVTFNPRSKVIEEIIRHTRKRHVEKVAFVEHHRGEVIEVRLGAESRLIDHPLMEAAREFPEDMVIGAVSRQGEVLIPTGETVLQTDDDLVIFVSVDSVDEVLEKV